MVGFEGDVEGDEVAFADDDPVLHHAGPRIPSCWPYITSYPTPIGYPGER
jgi:hypothetical protein